jgi:hypothetical protein
MAKHYTSRKAICPFYRHESRQVIYCEGVEEGTVLHLAFANPSECLDYKKRFCRCNHTQCFISDMLISKYNNINNNME